MEALTTITIRSVIKIGKFVILQKLPAVSC